MGDHHYDAHLLSADDWKKKGDDATEARDFKTAIDCYSNAIDLEPTNHLFFSSRCSTYLSQHDASKALADSEECIRLHPGWSHGYGQKGASLYQLGDFDNAIDTYKHGLGMEPDSAYLKKSLADVEETALKYRSPSPESMYFAARAGDLPGINALLRMGCEVNQILECGEDNREETGLLGAIDAQQEEAVRLLLSAGADVNLEVPDRPSPIVYAVAVAPHAGIVELLMKAGASADELCNEPDGLRLVHCAVDGGHADVVRVLLAAGADPDALTQPMKVPVTHVVRAVTPICLAVVRGHTEVVRELVQAGASVQVDVDNDQRSLLHHAARYGYTHMMQLLLAAGARRDARTIDGGMSPIQAAVTYNQPPAVKILLDAGDSATETYSMGSFGPGRMTLLMVAACSGFAEVVRVLLAAGARVDAFAMAAAVEYGHLAAVKEMIKAGASAQDLPSLSSCAVKGNVEMVKVLVAAGADIEACKNKWNKKTPLYNAAAACQAEVVDVLVEAGCDVNVQCKDGFTPLTMCLFAQNTLSHLGAAHRIVKRLINAGADLRLRTKDVGFTALHAAAGTFYPPIVQDLLDAGADAGARDKYGNTPLVYVLDGEAKTPAHHKSAEWRRRVAETTAILRGGGEKSCGAAGAVVAGARAGGSGGCVPIPDETGGKGRMEGKKKKKKKKGEGKKKSRVCDGPDCSSLGVKLCRACRRPTYCGVECQRAHWNAGHKEECKMWREEK